MSHQRLSVKLNGMMPDVIPEDVPPNYWNTVNNVLFKNGETVRIAQDFPTLPNATTTPRVCVFNAFQLGRYWVYANENGIWAHDGTAETDITPASGWTGPYDPDVYWTATILGGIVYINASDRDPVYWAGDVAIDAAPLPGWITDERCNALRAHKNFLFAIGIQQNLGQRVRWSDAAEPGTVPSAWSPAADNLAGFVDLAPTSAPAFDGAPMRDSFVVYKTESLWLFDFIGGNDVFAARKMFADHGIARPNAVTQGIDDIHVFFGEDGDIYTTDGVRVQSILDGKSQREFYAEVVNAQRQIFQGLTLSREKIAIMCYPGFDAAEGTMNRAIVYDFSSGEASFRDMSEITCGASGQQLIDQAGAGESWDAAVGDWQAEPERWNLDQQDVTIDDVMIGNASGFAMLSGNSGADPVDDQIAVNLEKLGLDFGDANARKLVARLWPRVRGVEGDQLVFRLGGQEVTGGPVSLSPPVTFTIGQDRHLDLFVSGRYINLNVQSLGGSPWQLGRIDFEVRMQGEF